MSHPTMPKDHQLTVARARSFHAAATTNSELIMRNWITEHYPAPGQLLLRSEPAVSAAEAGIASALIGELLAIIDHLTT